MNSSSPQVEGFCSNFTLYVCPPSGQSISELATILVAQGVLLLFVLVLGGAYLAKVHGYLGKGSVEDEKDNAVVDQAQFGSIRLTDEEFLQAGRDQAVEETVSRRPRNRF